MGSLTEVNRFIKVSDDGTAMISASDLHLCDGKTYCMARLLSIDIHLRNCLWNNRFSAEGLRENSIEMKELLGVWKSVNFGYGTTSDRGSL